jgi:hypothetical protein
MSLSGASRLTQRTRCALLPKSLRRDVGSLKPRVEQRTTPARWPHDLRAIARIARWELPDIQLSGCDALASKDNGVRTQSAPRSLFSLKRKHSRSDGGIGNKGELNPLAIYTDHGRRF